LWIRISAAAVLLVVSLGLFYALKLENRQLAKVPSTTSKPDDISPGGDKAVLTLADGRKIILDTASNGALTVEGGIKVIKAGGQLSYNEQIKSSEVLYNTISTPRGGQYQLELADGSRVWLNAASSLRFPTAFIGDDRTVELTGEGYFEVAHDASRPFHVKVGDMDVKVLGTHFNINSYPDEPTIETTLLQGRVSVRKGQQFVFLNPGQQAIVAGSQVQIDNDVDVEEVVAWKNGWFNFNSLRIQDILRQLSRWYNVDIVYEGEPTQHHFTGMVSRNSKVSEVLKIMEQAGMVFKIDGKTITVLK
jgi:ferric-dicitrate binding protein FerR (iron transport regulator)